MTMYSWIHLRKENDLSFLFKSSDKHRTKLSPKQESILYSVWLDIMTQFYKEFGQSENFIEELEIKEKIITLNIQYIETDNKFVLNEVNILKEKLLKIQADNIDRQLKVDSDKQMKQQIAFVASTLRSPVDLKQIKVFAFYTQLSLSELRMN